MAGRLDRKVAIITGAASGIGAASARRFAEEGARLAIVDRNRKLLESVLMEINDAGGDARAITADISLEADIERMVAETIEAFGELHILFANAGVSRRLALEEASIDDFDWMVTTNLRGSFLCAKHAVPRIREAGGGSVLFTSSELALIASPNMAVYSATKASLIGMARCLALDYAEQGIRFNCVCPGATDTPMLWRPEKGERAEIEAGVVRRMPMGRPGTPEEVANAALFLVSDESSFVTGHALVVDGGRILN